MKNKVVIFTENNARIFVNPAELEAFEKKPNAYVNPDLRFVTGVAPQHWTQVKGAQPIKAEDANKLKQLIGDLVDWSKEHDSFDQVFYKNLYEVLDIELANTVKASKLLARLVEMVDAINPTDVKSQLEERLIVKSTDPVTVKQNKAMRDLIDRWEHGLIVPMSDDDIKSRDQHIQKHGAINEYKPRPQQYNKWYVLAACVMVIIAAAWKLIK